MFNSLIFLTFLCREQPPPCGCVLKPDDMLDLLRKVLAAASVRLCVETILLSNDKRLSTQPPPCGCVLKPRRLSHQRLNLLAAASVRLCVETLSSFDSRSTIPAAASVRLCVETTYSSIPS